MRATRGDPISKAPGRLDCRPSGTSVRCGWLVFRASTLDTAGRHYRDTASPQTTTMKRHRLRVNKQQLGRGVATSLGELKGGLVPGPGMNLHTGVYSRHRTGIAIFGSANRASSTYGFFDGARQAAACQNLQIEIHRASCLKLRPDGFSDGSGTAAISGGYWV